MHSTTSQRAKERRSDDELLDLLKAMADERGRSWVKPTDRAHCVRQIRALMRLPRLSAEEILAERHQIADDMATRRGDAARYRHDELEGHGSSATHQRTTWLARYTALDGTAHNLRGRWTDDGYYQVLDYSDTGHARFVCRHKKHSKLKRDIKRHVANHCKGDLNLNDLDPQLH